MKKWKKLSALLLALIMCFTLFTTTASAIGETGNHIYYNGNGNTGGSAPGRTAFYWTTVDWELNVWAKVAGPGTLVKEGHTFAGWNSNAAGTGTSYSVNQWVRSPGHWTGGFFSVYLFDNLNLYAQWTMNTYDVTFKTSTGGTINGGTSDVVVNDVNHGTAMSTILPAVAADTGYTFTGWSPSLPSTVTSGGTYTATFILNTYDVNFATMSGGTIDGGTASILVADVNHGTLMSTITPTTAADEGYHFTGWSPALPTTVTIGASYTATYAINTYDVTFMASTGGTIDGGTVAILKEDVEHGTLMSTIAPEAVAIHGYSFAGWSPLLPETVTIGASYTAQFTLNDYTMTFNSMGGTAVAPITQDYNTQITKPADPTRTHHTFAGWYDSENNLITFPYTLEDDITVFAKWTINNYTMMFNSQGGTSVTPVTQNYNTQVTKPADPTRYGFTFSGWYTGVNGTGTAISFPYTLIGNITVHARWTAGTYTMSFNSEGGSSVASISGNFGEYITSAATPTKAGYTFEGWYSAPGGTGSKINFPYNLVGNVTVYAKWTAIPVISEPSVASTVSQSTASTVSQATASIPQNQTPTDVPNMGNSDLSAAAITIAIFSILLLAGLVIRDTKKRKAEK